MVRIHQLILYINVGRQQIKADAWGNWTRTAYGVGRLKLRYLDAQKKTTVFGLFTHAWNRDKELVSVFGVDNTPAVMTDILLY